ncbi:beta-aspartyl-peptidase [Fretibacterium sp. OH1220_COT-178]|uniref:beta-aspartyl-peptidase n=1 Tax=Fretibacterium sp. OH1220_COT-178 TaxID=2491047 RepID=UPI000F5F50C5|nr:beta-aspartyl-peptidase [Fretibacterium sp. OH1220_COT-178]RRD64114.1 beta-aspartyl-peptidase [Fretibacterium sp. OH1220_COT-178]
MLLIENANILSPAPLGLGTLVVVGERIAAVHPAGAAGELRQHMERLGPEVTVLDAQGAKVLPGVIDRHVHFNGAGGEGGPRFRTPPLQLSSFVRAGVTSAVGLTGTDGTCRGLRDLLMKARGLEEEGLSTWILTGSYAVPSPTLTGGVMDDLCLIDKVIGLKIALSDHRSSHPTVEELRRAVSDARVGGMLAGKAGTVCVHMGSEPSAFDPLLAAIEGTDVPLAQFAPTHVSRSEALLERAVEYGLRGGNLDITAAPGERPVFGLPTRRAVKRLLAGGVAAERITLSSDGNGSMPRFDAGGKLVGMGIGPIDSVLACVLELMEDPEVGPEKAVGMATSHVADQLCLPRKGRLKEGCDADILVLDGNDALRHVVARGRVMMRDGGVLARGTFETQE